ncbi:MAG: DUF3068 domain-containing protein [Magnetococcus sp. DMHC-1]
MKFGVLPGLTEEEKVAIERHHQLADRIAADRKANPANYFREEDMTGVKIYHPNEKIPPSAWDQMKASGEVDF